MNPLLPRALLGLAMAGLAAWAAWRSAQGPARPADDPRFRPRGNGFGRAFGDAFRTGRSSGADGAAGAGRTGAGSDRRDPLPMTRRELAGLRDALSGAPLDPGAELFACARCRSLYAVASVRALASENGARCIGCGSIERVAVAVVDADR